MEHDTGDYCELQNAGTELPVYAQLHNPDDNTPTDHLYENTQ